MKPLLLLAALAVCAPLARAQEVAPAPTELAHIDPAARDLLARTAARYQKFRSFESLIEWKIGPAGAGLQPRRFRVQMTIDGQFIVGEEFPDKSWHKAICDGKTLIEFRSKFPKTYTRKSVKSPLYLGLSPQLEAALRSVGAEGPLISLMLGDDFGAALLDPDLESVSMQTTGELQTIAISLHAPPSSATPAALFGMNMTIAARDLTLHQVDVSDENGLVFTESYAQTRFNPEFDAAQFRAAAPLNYRVVPYFDEDVTTASTPPQEFATP